MNCPNCPYSLTQPEGGMAYCDTCGWGNRDWFIKKYNEACAKIMRLESGGVLPLVELDDFTQRRMDDDGEAPDYGLVLDIRGYRIGTTNKVRWQVIPVESSADIDVEDGVHIAEVLEKVIEVLRAGETYREPEDGSA